MLGSKSGFQAKVKELAPQAESVQRMIHRCAVVSKTLPDNLQSLLDSVTRIKSRPLNARLFRVLCKDMTADHETLLYYTSVWWLSKGNVVNRVFELKDEIREFLDLQNKQELLDYLNDGT